MSVCPACHEDVHAGAPSCPACAWQLAGEPVLGPLTDAARATFEEKLAAHAAAKVRTRSSTERQILFAQLIPKAPAPRPLDLVCAVELCGPDVAVKERIDFARAVIDAVGNRFTDDEDARFGVVAYLDHADRRTPHAAVPPPVRGVEQLGAAAESLALLDAWSPEPQMRGDDCTAVEDALRRMLDLDWRPLAEDVERMVVLIGRRPPCLDPTDAHGRWRGVIAPCDDELSWKWVCNELRTSRGVRLVAVRDPEAGPGGEDGVGTAIRRYADDTWLAVAHQARYQRTAHAPPRLRDLSGVERTALAALLPEHFPDDLDFPGQEGTAAP